jgi:hypothetical protein
MLRRDAADEKLRKINPAALCGEAAKMECRLAGTNAKRRRL